MEYPIYVEYGNATQKIEDAETYVDVENNEWDAGIMRKKKAGNVVRLMTERGHRVTEAAFNNAFQNALTKIQSINHEKLITSPQLTTF